jgi:periplasmic divalent cation tolerance protein
MTTCPTAEDAELLASRLLDQKLAACIQVLDITSRYTWQGKTTSEPEKLLLIKTRLSLYSKVEAAILAGHRYEVPEVTCIPIEAGSVSYLGWIADVTSPA